MAKRYYKPKPKYDPRDLVKSREEPIIVPAIFEVSEDTDPGQFAGLMKHQAQAVNTVKAGYKNMYLALDQGLGKTYTSLASAAEAEDFPLLIVCLSSGKLNWAREAEKWIGKDSQILKGRKTHNLDSDIVIINYEILPYWETTLKDYGFKGLVVDEAHNCKNKNAKRTQSVKNIADSIDGLKMLLSGTPTPNSVYDLVAQLEIMDALKYFGDARNFAARYTRPYLTDYGISYKRAQNLQELAANLKRVGFFRRRKQDCLDLPEKVVMNVPVDVSTDESFYDDILTAMTKPTLQNATEAVSRVYSGVELEGQMSAARAALGEAKVDSIVELAENSAKPLVIMVWHKSVQDAIYKKLSKNNKCSFVPGGLTIEKRQQELDDFQEGRTDIIVCSIGAAGTGVNLQRASNMIIGELPFTSAALEQAQDRIHRIGQQNNVLIQRVIAPNTLDDVLLAIISQKATTSAAVEDEMDISTTSVVDIIARQALRLYLDKHGLTE